jgi:hypothetical protein
VRDYDSVRAASRQAGEVLRSNASGEQKRAAVKVLGGAIAGEVSKKVGEHVVREGRKALRKPAARAALKSLATKAGPVALAWGVGTALAAAAIAAAAIGIQKQHAKLAAQFANRELEKAAKRLPDLTPEQAATLWHQLYDYALKQPAATNTFLGK